MDRRLIGALLVVVVLAGAMTVPVLGGLRIPGMASAVEPHRAPRLGDCLLERPRALNPAPIGLRASAAPEPTRQRAPAPGPLGPTVVSCGSESVASEVILTISPGGTPGGLERAVADSGVNCRSAALAYAGLRSAGASPGATQPVGLRTGGASDGPVTWKMTVNVRTTWIYPSAFQRASGHSWAACVGAPPVNRRYSGSLADALAGGRLPDEFGTCWNPSYASAGMKSVDCRQPHRSELLSAGVVINWTTVSTTALRAACTSLAVAATGRRDPTEGGRLLIKTAPERMYGSGPDRSASVLCYLATADQPLTGTLIGLHERPVPFAN